MLYLIMWSVSQSLVFRQMRYQLYGIEMAVVFLFHYKKNAQKNQCFNAHPLQMQLNGFFHVSYVYVFAMIITYLSALNLTYRMMS